jgi:hypothetical protein
MHVRSKDVAGAELRDGAAEYVHQRAGCMRVCAELRETCGGVADGPDEPQ